MKQILLVLSLFAIFSARCQSVRSSTRWQYAIRDSIYHKSTVWMDSRDKPLFSPNDTIGPTRALIPGDADSDDYIFRRPSAPCWIYLPGESLRGDTFYVRTLRVVIAFESYSFGGAPLKPLYFSRPNKKKGAKP